MSGTGLQPLTSRLISLQPVLGSELQSFQLLACTGSCFFFVRARRWRGVAWRGVACGVWRVAGP